MLDKVPYHGEVRDEAARHPDNGRYTIIPVNYRIWRWSGLFASILEILWQKGIEEWISHADGEPASE